MSQPIYLRPPEHPRWVRLCTVLLTVGALALLAGAPIWWFMHETAVGWQNREEVTVTVEEDAECRTGPPPGNPRTCEATWSEAGVRVVGEVSDRYGGQVPGPGESGTARVVRDGASPMAYSGYADWALLPALASPYAAVAGLLLLGGSVGALMRLDPRWRSRRTDLPPPESRRGR